jgi:hypothetical protein
MATAPKKKPGPKPHPRPPKAEHSAPKNPKLNSVANVRAKAATQEKRFAKLRATAVEATTARTQAVKSPNRHLTEMQQMFVRHWAAGESILTASARAGYADGGTYAYRLSKDPLVVEVYQREKRLYEQSCQMTRKKVMDGFLEAAEMARLQADPTAMVGAWREVGKMCGYYEPVKKVIDVNINGQITQKVERLDDATLLAIIKGQAGGDVLDVVFKEVMAIENQEAEV